MYSLSEFSFSSYNSAHKALHSVLYNALYDHSRLVFNAKPTIGIECFPVIQSEAEARALLSMKLTAPVRWWLLPSHYGFIGEVRKGHKRTILRWLLTLGRTPRTQVLTFSPTHAGHFQLWIWILLSHFFLRNRYEIPKRNEGCFASSLLLLDVLLCFLFHTTYTRTREQHAFF